MKILVINGPNLNMLGIREPDIYGKSTYKDLTDMIEAYCEEKNVEVKCYQSNHEGALVDEIQSAYGTKDGIVINPGAYTHTSVALLDALKAVGIPAVEVHISKVDEREDFRQISYIRNYCEKTITGLGFDGYIKAIEYLIERDGKNDSGN
ncbi:MAG: type II 3-dehydroquinate dehydratase [Clostridia bacterium]|nr:type II 3-dehydroquinate dehydratase [Clostridia bacterium]